MSRPEIQDFKKDVGQFFDKLICKQKSRLDTLKDVESISRDDLLTLAGDDCKDLISASRKICHNLSRRRAAPAGFRANRSRKWTFFRSRDGSASFISLRAAAMTLTISGYDTRIARRIRHEEFYDKVVLPVDEPLEAELQKSATRKPDSGIRNSPPGPAPRMLPKKNPSPAPTSEEEEESEEDVSSPAEDAKEKDPEGNASPSKAE
ncbi:hypothetical protein QYE76_030265 [Lolium multiflorum]|uniref:Uncharacterized protein n=1 Tax=Lolium multiflorum TaxID=4521 RepID=A0AAD8QQ25_LOLMU|nr:hypothetical protein QYE76_030265 [Lolium multiflorum]